jgi:hypothetical protein
MMMVLQMGGMHAQVVCGRRVCHDAQSGCSMRYPASPPTPTEVLDLGPMCRPQADALLINDARCAGPPWGGAGCFAWPRSGCRGSEPLTVPTANILNAALSAGGGTEWSRLCTHTGSENRGLRRRRGRTALAADCNLSLIYTARVYIYEGAGRARTHWHWHLHTTGTRSKGSGRQMTFPASLQRAG